MTKYITLLLTIGLLHTAQAQFGKYKRSFARYYKVKVDTEIMFEEIGKRTALAIPSRNIIVVNRKMWERLSKTARKWVIYHELLHEMYRVEHTDDGLMYWKHPMNPTVEEFKNARLEAKKFITK